MPTRHCSLWPRGHHRGGTASPFSVLPQGGLKVKMTGWKAKPPLLLAVGEGPGTWPLLPHGGGGPGTWPGGRVKGYFVPLETKTQQNPWDFPLAGL